MTIEYACRVVRNKRAHNDDRAMVDGRIIEGGYMSGKGSIPIVAAVCDGCGGYKGGWLAAETVLKQLREKPASDIADCDALASVLDLCEDRVNAIQNRDSEYSEMCTTIAGVVLNDWGALIFHSGDSRVYRFDGRFLAQMTIDHSLSQEWSLGITEDCLPKNIITRCIGIKAESPDIYEAREQLSNNEIYMICSDGLSGAIDNTRIRRILTEETSLDEMTARFVFEAIDAGSTDNITVLVLRGIS